MFLRRGLVGKSYHISFEPTTVNEKHLQDPFILTVNPSEFITTKKDGSPLAVNFEKINNKTYRIIHKPGQTALSNENFVESLEQLKSATEIKQAFENYQREHNPANRRR